MRYLLLSFLIAIFVFPLLSARADGPLRSIIVFGNKKTDRRTILDIINVKSRTYVDRRLLQEVDDRLVNSGLFKTVKVVKISNSNGTADLRITVSEKQLWFVFPLFKAWSGRYTGGAAFGESNLFVPNASTLIAVQGGNKLNRFFSAFDAKNIFESNFSVRTWVMARSDEIPLYSGKQKVDEVKIQDLIFALTPGFQWTNDIRTSYTVKYRYIDYGQSSLVNSSGNLVVPESGISGHDVSMVFDFEYNTLRRREAFLKGNRIRAVYEFAESRFGTDFTYHNRRPGI